MGQTSKNQSVTHLRAFLRENPHLFRDHPELLEELELGGDPGETVVSLERARTRRLERKVAELERELEELVATARDNDRLARQLHRLTMDLLDCRDSDELVHTLLEGVRHNFRVEAVGLRVAREWFADSLDPRFLAPQLWVQNCFVAESGIRLGPPSDGETVQSLYGATEDAVRSQALLPLREGSQVFGVLALGSDDGERYRAGMGTAYLEQMAEMAGAMLARCRTAR
jgi:hypothetical protein